ncbi:MULTISPECIES: hypothetical protein [Clostridium]|jgi:hypothetical protein|uniref:hypothetical protein n=1 Tax=Clostridium TaxID=1485 RepID=UPI000288A966|nr:MULTISPECIES: hypothetical protein [Clostridium]MDF2502674.1 hypothetical protein [Clostridium sp.]
MAAYSKILLIGHESKDGLEDIYLEILQGEGEKRWYEAKYDEEKINRLGSVSSVIPVDRDDPNSILDACIAFAPKLFEDCPSLNDVKSELKGKNMIDFSTGDNVPKSWNKLREEAKKDLKDIHIYEASIKRHKLLSENIN